MLILWHSHRRPKPMRVLSEANDFFIKLVNWSLENEVKDKIFISLQQYVHHLYIYTNLLWMTTMMIEHKRVGV